MPRAGSGLPLTIPHGRRRARAGMKEQIATRRSLRCWSRFFLGGGGCCGCGWSGAIGGDWGGCPVGVRRDWWKMIAAWEMSMGAKWLQYR